MLTDIDSSVFHIGIGDIYQELKKMNNDMGSSDQKKSDMR